MGSTRPGHGEGVSPRPHPARQSDRIGSGKGTNRTNHKLYGEVFTHENDPRELKPSIDNSGTATVSARVPATRVSGSQNPREQRG